MLLMKAQGNCSVGPYVWDHDGAIVEVPDQFGEELLAIKGHDYTQVQDFAPGDPVSGAVVEESEPLDISWTAAKILSWIGDDKERAAQALEAERAKGDGARSSLVAKLEKLAA